MFEYIGLAVFICVGAAALLMLFVPLRKLLRYFMWREASPILLNTEIAYDIVEKYLMNGRLVPSYGHVPKISYQYQVGQDSYESTSIVDPLEETMWFGSEAKASQFLASITSDESIRVLYNPRNPSDSVLINRVRAADVVGVVAGSTISTIFFSLVVLFWPTQAPELDFPFYQNAEVYAYPGKDDQPKFWTLTSSDGLDDVVAFYNANVGNGWRASSSWQPGLSGSVYKIWERVATEGGRREKVTVRVQAEKFHIRKGLEVSIGYDNELLRSHVE